jgi:diadenosine tetraphosphate (Ap4A) HIT family hydrolase
VRECIFCDLVAGRGAASIVYEDDVVMAFLDIAPVTPGHTLVVPKHHASGLSDLDEQTGMHLFRVAQRVAGALRRSGLRCEGINLFLADGAPAFQEVFHIHLHVLPRFQGDGFKIDADWNIQPCRTELDETAAQISRAFAQLQEIRDQRSEIGSQPPISDL